jgi:hypothetical protein
VQWRTYIVFAVFCIAMTIHVFFMFPETAGKPLEEVNEMFEDPNGIKYIGTPVRIFRPLTFTVNAKLIYDVITGLEDEELLLHLDAHGGRRGLREEMECGSR